MSIDFTKLTPIARVTEKATGKVWNIYRVASEKGKASYEVAVLEEKGVAVECTCPNRVNRLRVQHRSCKHMIAMTDAIKVGRNMKPLITLFGYNIQSVDTAIRMIEAAKAQKEAARLADEKKVITLAERAKRSNERAALNGDQGFSMMKRA